MLKYIVLNDIVLFLHMYVFVLLGFGFAFHALFQLSPAIAGSVGSARLGSVGSPDRSDRNYRISWTQIAPARCDRIRVVHRSIVCDPIQPNLSAD